MNWKPLAYFAPALILGWVFLQTNSAAAQSLSFKTKSQPHVCAGLIEPTLNRARRTTRKMAARNIQSQMIDITKILGREPKLQEALECLMRHQKAK